MRTTVNHDGIVRVLFAAASCACMVLSGAVARAGQGGPNAQCVQTASRLVAGSGRAGGFCSVLGPGNADLALALARQGRFVVQALYSDAAACDRARRAIRSAGSYGLVSANTWSGGPLPYADNLINIFVAADYAAGSRSGLSLEEVFRVLAPLGTAWFGPAPAGSGSGDRWTEQLRRRLKALGAEPVAAESVAGSTWVRAVKPWPADIDEWTHYLHGPDGNPVARDRVVAPPQHYQWLAEPRWLRSHETDSSISTLVTARGRLFYIVDEAPISLAGDNPLPDKWSLAARDAFNGCLLWKVPIQQWGWRVWKNSWFSCRPGDFPLDIRKRLVAVGDRVYVTLGYDAPVSELDARTGRLIKSYAGTEHAGEILYFDGTLILPVLREDRIKVMAVDAGSGQTKWVSKNSYRGSTVDYLRWRSARGKVKPPKVNPAANAATDGQVVALIDGPQIVCLEFRTGAEKWRADFPADPADLKAGGIQSHGNLWNGTMIVRDGVVLHASPYKLAAFAAEDGKLLWSRPKSYIGHLWYEWKDVFVIGDLVWTWSGELGRGAFDTGRKRKQHERWPKTVNGYDLHSGELKRQVALGPIFKTYHHHRCYRNKATVRYILASRRGTEYVDLTGGRHSVHNWIRGTCHVGMMPANGLQYVPPHPCACYMQEKLNGFLALAPGRGRGQERSAAGTSGVEAAGRLRYGPAYRPGSSEQSAPSAQPASWPTFRHDSMRTGSVTTSVPDDARQLWRVKLGRKVSPPVVADGKLLAALIDEHHVVCLDADDGAKRWEFAAGGRVDSPPTYYGGTVIFGSADGWVYCLRAEDGAVVWRFRAAPAERLIGAFGQFESAWPVHGSVLVQNGTVYFAAGRTSQLDGGIYLYGLEAATGKLRCQNRLQGPDYVLDPSGQKLLPVPPEAAPAGQAGYDQNFKLPMGTLPDILMGDGTNIYMRGLTFDAELKQTKGRAPLQALGGLLDDTYFKRAPWTFGRNADYARLIAHDNRAVYFIRQFDTLRGLDPSVYFTPGSKGYLLFAKNVGGKGKRWSERIAVRVRAMVLTADRLFVAGPPDVVDPKDPLGAFEGRKGGLLCVLDAASGQKLAQLPLPHPPVFNGAAAADGRLFLVEEDGSVSAYGRP